MWHYSNSLRQGGYNDTSSLRFIEGIKKEHGIETVCIIDHSFLVSLLFPPPLLHRNCDRMVVIVACPDRIKHLKSARED